MIYDLIPTNLSFLGGVVTAYDATLVREVKMHNYLLKRFRAKKTSKNPNMFINHKARLCIYDGQFWKLAPKHFSRLFSSGNPTS